MDVVIEDRPYFSIVIPVFNREKEIVRAVNSCLAQTFTDVEIIIVDDASVDQTVRTIENINDSRIVLIRHDNNRGVCSARNTGIDHCRGEWVLFLDSDDELLPEALAIISQKTGQCPNEIERLGFLYQRDDGRLSPEPTPTDCVLDYESFIAWSANLSLNDFFHCTRRWTFAKERFTESRAYETSYALDFAKSYRTRMIPEIVALIHMDSANRSSNLSMAERVAGLLRSADDQAAMMEYILNNHGKVLHQYAPRYLRIYRKSRLLFTFLAGRRWEGSRLALGYLKSHPSGLEGWIIWIAGLISSRVLAILQVYKARRRHN